MHLSLPPTNRGWKDQLQNRTLIIRAVKIKNIVYGTTPYLEQDGVRYVCAGRQRLVVSGRVSMHMIALKRAAVRTYPTWSTSLSAQQDNESTDRDGYRSLHSVTILPKMKTTVVRTESVARGAESWRIAPTAGQHVCTVCVCAYLSQLNSSRDVHPCLLIYTIKTK